MTQSVLLTGASGFVGRIVARHLVTAGYAVRAVSRDPDRLRADFADVRALPGAASGPGEWDHLVDGIDHVVHCAGIAHASAAIPASAYVAANADLTEQLALSAKRMTTGRFVFLSSIRAVSGETAPHVVVDATPPQPDDDYGRSKLEAERRIATLFAGTGRYAILRPSLVYGPRLKGNLAALLRVARLPIPLPFAGLSARRSLVDAASLADAVVCLLRVRDLHGGPMLVCDRHPVSTAQIVSAMRAGLGRKPMLFGVPDPFLSGVLGLAGKEEYWKRLYGALVAEPSPLLEATGWRPAEDTAERIAAYVRGRR